MSKCEKCGTELAGYRPVHFSQPLEAYDVTKEREREHTKDRCIAALQARVAFVERESAVRLQITNDVLAREREHLKSLFALEAQLKTAREAMLAGVGKLQAAQNYFNTNFRRQCITEVCDELQAALDTHSGSGG